MKWKILDTGQKSAQENMLLDEKLLSKAAHEPILHFYDWCFDSITFGHFVNPAKYFDLEKAQRKGIDFAKRPTGGGIVFHMWDLAFSVIVPSSSRAYSQNTLENYKFVNDAVLQAVKNFLYSQENPHITYNDSPLLEKSCERFCMARPTKYDVMLTGRKIAGAAQRKTKNGFLHQGTIALLFPDRCYLEEILLENPKLIDAMFSYTFPLLGEKAGKKDLTEIRLALKTELAKTLTEESS